MEETSQSASAEDEPRPEPEPSPEFQAGAVLQGTYRILQPLACGGMGEVYEATHERLPGSFAVKVLHREFIHDEDALSRFRYEAEIMAALRHPNIVQVLDFNVTEAGSPYLVMELVEGKDLAEHLMENPRPMPPKRVARIVRQVASALEAAHGRGVVHRDLKPENVMLMNVDGQEDFVKVLDFGVSKVGWSHRVTAEWAILGTPQFMAPEQAQGRRDEVDHRSDQFALAAMTYTLLTAREPFRGENTVTVLYQVVHQETDPLSLYVGWPSAHTDTVLRRAMAKKREARFPSVLAFARALDEAIQQDLGRQERQPLGPEPALPVAGVVTDTDDDPEGDAGARAARPVPATRAAGRTASRPPWPIRRSWSSRKTRAGRRARIKKARALPIGAGEWDPEETTTVVSLRKRSAMLTMEIANQVRARPRVAAAGLLAAVAVATVCYLDMVGWHRVGAMFGSSADATSSTVARIRVAAEPALLPATGVGGPQVVPFPAAPHEGMAVRETDARSVGTVTP